MVFSLFQRNPTRNFRPPGPLPLEWNTANNRLNGLPFGAKISELSQFGKASGFSRFSSGSYGLGYADKGLFISTENDRISDVLFVIDDIAAHTSDPNFQCSKPHLAPVGITLSTTTTEVDMNTLFGDPHERDLDEEEAILTYRIGTTCYEFEFWSNGLMKTLCIYPDN